MNTADFSISIAEHTHAELYEILNGKYDLEWRQTVP